MKRLLLWLLHTHIFGDLPWVLSRNGKKNLQVKSYLAEVTVTTIIFFVPFWLPDCLSILRIAHKDLFAIEKKQIESNIVVMAMIKNEKLRNVRFKSVLANFAIFEVRTNSNSA